MESKTTEMSENSLDLEFFASIQSLTIEYSAEQRHSAITETKSKWQHFKNKLDDLNRTLPAFMINKIEKERLNKFSSNFNAFVKAQSSQVTQDYKMFASLDLAFQQNANLLEYNNVMKDLSLLVKECYLGMNSNLHAITTSNFQNRVLIEILHALAIEEIDFNNEIIYLIEVEKLPNDQMPEKKLHKAELAALLSSFEEILLSVFQEKMNSMLLRLRGTAEIACKALLDDISSITARIIAKLNSFEADTEGNEELNHSIDEYFLNSYSTEISFLQTKLKEALNADNIQKAEQHAIEQVIIDLNSMNTIESPKISLGEYFFKAKAAVILRKVPPTCLKLVQESKTSKVISILNLEDNLELVSREQKPFVIKYNHTYLVNLDSPDGIRIEEDPETIYYTTNEEFIKDFRKVEAKLGFFPPNLEFPKEETMILYFMVKLVRFIHAKEKMNEPNSLENDVLIDIGIGAFLSFSVSFLAEIAMTASGKKQYKSQALEKRVSLSTSTRISRMNSHETQIEKAIEKAIENGNEDEIVWNYSQSEESKSSLKGEPCTLEIIDRLESIDLAETDNDWEASDHQVFLKLLEQERCKLLNDLRTLKIVSGLQDYIFIDKNDSLEIFKEYISNRKNRSDNLNDFTSPSLEKLLLSTNLEIIKGIVLLFAPQSKLFNLVALRIDFETKNRIFFALETQNGDFSSLQNIFKGFGKFIKRAIVLKTPSKIKTSKIKDNYIFLKLGSDENVGQQCFKNFYFPYMYVLRQDLNASSTESISTDMLKEMFCTYLHATFKSLDGIEQIRNLLQVYHLYTNRYSNVIIIEEFNNFDRFYDKIQQYLRLCFVDNLEPTARKNKSIMIFGRILNGKLGTYDFVLIFFEYVQPLLVNTDKTNNLSKNSGQQNFYVFGDAYLHIVQVRGIIKSFFMEREIALDRVRFQFYQMKKSRTESNLLFFDKSLFSCVLFILLNESMPIADIISICRLCPAIQYKYLSHTFEKNHSSQYSKNHVPKDLGLDTKALRIFGRQGMELVHETYNTISILDLNQPDTLKWLVELKSTSGIKNVVAPMIPSGKNDSAFKINLKDLKLPTEPFTLITVNYGCDSKDTNLCNIIEPDGSVYILTVASEGGTDQNKVDKKQAAIIKSIEQIQKSLPKVKVNYKTNIVPHTMYLKHLTLDSIKALFDFIIVFYLHKYKTTKDSWFVVSENSILSLIFVDLNVCFHNAQECTRLLKLLHENRFLLLDNTFVERAHKYYTDEHLVTLLGVSIANKNTRALIFCIQNELEYSFHLILKSPKPNSYQMIVVTIKDQSKGKNAKNFYDELIYRMQDGVFVGEPNCEFTRFELESLPSFFHSIDPNLLSIALADAVHILQGQDYCQTIQQYLQTWYQPTILSSQFKAVAKNFENLM